MFPAVGEYLCKNTFQDVGLDIKNSVIELKLTNYNLDLFILMGEKCFYENK